MEGLPNKVRVFAKSAITWLTALAVVISAAALPVARTVQDGDLASEIIAWATRILAWIGITVLVLRRVIELPKGRPIDEHTGVIPVEPVPIPAPTDPEPFEPIPQIEPEPIEEPELEPVFEETVVEPEPVVEAEPEPVPEPPPPPQPKPPSKRTTAKQKAKHHPSNQKPVTDG